MEWHHYVQLFFSLMGWIIFLRFFFCYNLSSSDISFYIKLNLITVAIYFSLTAYRYVGNIKRWEKFQKENNRFDNAPDEYICSNFSKIFLNYVRENNKEKIEQYEKRRKEIIENKTDENKK